MGFSISGRRQPVCNQPYPINVRRDRRVTHGFVKTAMLLMRPTRRADHL